MKADERAVKPEQEIPRSCSPNSIASSRRFRVQTPPTASASVGIFTVARKKEVIQAEKRMAGGLE